MAGFYRNDRRQDAGITIPGILPHFAIMIH
jgi:hypothetical protein